MRGTQFKPAYNEKYFTLLRRHPIIFGYDKQFGYLTDRAFNDPNIATKKF